MKHLSDIAAESWFTARPWLVCGTGPSLERYEKHYANLYNIWTINSAIEATGWADVAAMHDYDLIRELYLPPAERVELADWVTHATAARFSTRVSSMHLEPWIAAADTARKLHYFEFDRDIAELQDGRRYFADKPLYVSSNSSSFAFYFLGQNGIRTIYTIGIDGGKGVTATNIGNKYRQRMAAHDFDKENEGQGHWEREYNLTAIKL